MDCSSSMLTIEEGAFSGGNVLGTARHAPHSPGATRPAESMGRFDLHRVDAIPLCICMFSVACFRSSSFFCVATCFSLRAWAVAHEARGPGVLDVCRRWPPSVDKAAMNG